LVQPKFLAGVTRKDGVQVWYSAKSQKGNPKNFSLFPFWDFAEYHTCTPSFRVTPAKKFQKIFSFFICFYSPKRVHGTSAIRSTRVNSYFFRGSIWLENKKRSRPVPGLPTRGAARIDGIRARRRRRGAEAALDDARGLVPVVAPHDHVAN